eukprot:scaffold7234_cov335-Prasinococcus_capsulatus_cf.AAC.10
MLWHIKLSLAVHPSPTGRGVASFALRLRATMYYAKHERTAQPRRQSGPLNAYAPICIVLPGANGPKGSDREYGCGRTLR